jgi:plasmid stability protein
MGRSIAGRGGPRNPEPGAHHLWHTLFVVTNLTVAIDEEVLRRARIRALERGTSVNALVREFVESLAGNERDAALDRLLALARSSTAGSGPGGRTWRRDELYHT